MLATHVNVYARAAGTYNCSGYVPTAAQSPGCFRPELEGLNYKQPPYSTRYPELVRKQLLFELEPASLKAFPAGQRLRQPSVRADQQRDRGQHLLPPALAQHVEPARVYQPELAIR